MPRGPEAPEVPGEPDRLGSPELPGSPAGGLFVAMSPEEESRPILAQLPVSEAYSRRKRRPRSYQDGGAGGAGGPPAGGAGAAGEPAAGGAEAAAGAESSPEPELSRGPAGVAGTTGSWRARRGAPAL